MSTSRTVAVCGVALLLVLSGCGGLLGDGGGSGPGTPTLTDPARQVDDGDLPPGLNTTVRGNATTVVLEDASALLAAHETAVAENGARTRTVTNTSIAGAGNATVTTTRGADGTFGLEYTTTFQRGTIGLDLYSNGSVTHQRQSAGTVTVYSRFLTGFYRTRLNSTSSLRQYVAIGDFELTAVESDGERLTLTAEGLGNYSDPALPDPANVSSYEAEFVVDGDGLIRSLTAELVVNASGREITSSVEYALETASVDSVEEPAWTATAVERASLARLSFAVEGDTIAITHEGGDTVPQGSTVGVAATSQGATSFSVQLDEDLEPGETAYVYRAEGESTGSVSVGSEPTATPASLPDAMQVSVGGPDGRSTYAVVELDDDEES